MISKVEGTEENILLNALDLIIFAKSNNSISIISSVMLGFIAMNSKIIYSVRDINLLVSEYSIKVSAVS